MNVDVIDRPIAQTATTMDRALKVMQNVLDDEGATWRSVQQKEAMEATLRRESDVVAVLPTGSGKSMLAIVPSLLEDMATVLVVPLNSLIMDYERRLRAMNVPHQVYQSSSRLDSRDNLIVVSADKALTSHWQNNLDDLVRRRPLSRFVMDECHIPLIAKGYRRPLQHIRELRSQPVPLVLLTATLPPAFLPELSTMYALTGTTRVVRRSTNRPELRYVLKKSLEDEKGLIEEAARLIDESRVDWKASDRGLVFVPSIDLCRAMAEHGGHACYMGGDAMSDEEHQRGYHEWLKGEPSPVMVATSAFSTGNDYPHVRLVLHLDKPFDMVEYMQGQGRAGRDGAPAMCYALVPSVGRTTSYKSEEIERNNEQALLEHLYLYGMKRCLRYGVTLFNDGEGQCCLSDEDNQRCSVCEGNRDHRPQDIRMAAMPRTSSSSSTRDTFALAVQGGREQRAKRDSENLAEAERLGRALDLMHERCSLCAVSTSNACQDQHELQNCPYMRNWNEYLEWRRRLKYQRHHYMICYKCHVPQISDALHPTLTKTTKGKGISCRYADVIGPIAFAIYKDALLRRAAEDDMRCDFGKDLIEYAKWLMGVPRNDQRSNLLQVFMWWCQGRA